MSGYPPIATDARTWPHFFCVPLPDSCTAANCIFIRSPRRRPLASRAARSFAAAAARALRVAGALKTDWLIAAASFDARINGRGACAWPAIFGPLHADLLLVYDDLRFYCRGVRSSHGRRRLLQNGGHIACGILAPLLADGRRLASLRCFGLYAAWTFGWTRNSLVPFGCVYFDI